MFAEDLSEFFDVDDGHAVTATIAGEPVAAIFSNAAKDALYAAGTSPSLLAESAEVNGLARGAAVVVNGASYTVAKVEHDGTGLARVLLELAEQPDAILLEGGLGGIGLEAGGGRLIKEVNA